MSGWLVYLCIFAILVAGELLYFRVAAHFNIVDEPNVRSSHKSVVLRGGGIVFLLGAWLWAIFFGFGYPWFLAGLGLIALISFLDDVKPQPGSVRLVFQFLAVFLMFCQLGIPGWDLWWLVLIAWIVSVGIVNAYNFMDGINGITGAYSIAVLLPLIVVNGFAGTESCPADTEAAFMDPDFLPLILLSVLVFCFFNFRKRARCFAGDVGAVSIAFILVFAMGRLMMKTGDFSYVVFLAVYGVDSVLTIVHRIILREPLGVAHRKHAYQIMANELKMPHLLVAGIYMGLQLLVSAGLIWLPLNHYIYAALVLVLLGMGYILFIKKYYPLHAAYLKKLGK